MMVGVGSKETLQARCSARGREGPPGVSIFLILVNVPGRWPALESTANSRKAIQAGGSGLYVLRETKPHYVAPGWLWRESVTTC